MSETNSMNPDRCAERADAYGGDVSRWPGDEQARARAFMTTDPDQAQALLDEERFRRDYSRRLAEDAEFERTQARKGYEQFRREEAVFGKRIERLDLLEGL